MNELEERARRVLDAGRSLHDPSVSDAQRVRARLQARVHADPLLIEPHLPSALAGRGVLEKVLLALGVGGVAGFAAGFFVAHSLASVSPSQAVAPAPSIDAPVSVNGDDTAELARPGVATPPEASQMATPARGALDDELPRAAPTRVTPRVTPRGAPTAAATPPVASQLKAELDGLRRAQELLHRGDAAWAIARLDELDRANVSSLLLEERMATRAIAECRRGNDGRAQTDELVRQFPHSAHLEQVRTSCEQAHQSGAPAKNSVPTQTETGGSPHR